MPRRILNYIAHHAIAILALVCSMLALGASSYAALSLPKNSVGAPQIRNEAISAAKLNPGSIAASIRAWVNIQWGTDGRLIAKASSSGVKVASEGIGATINWPHHRFGRTCIPSVTPQENLNSKFGLPDYVTARFDPTNRAGAFLSLLGVGADGSRGPQAAYIVIICP
jgi:hypothetical protein